MTKADLMQRVCEQTGLSGLEVTAGVDAVLAVLKEALQAGERIQMATLDHLRALGFDPGPADGVFTEQTAEAIRQYQRRYGLVVSGLLDPATRHALGIERQGEGGT